MSGDQSNQNLISDIQSGENFEQKNNAEIYTADNGMRINIKDQTGANFITNTLGEQNSITKDPNMVTQQPQELKTEDRHKMEMDNYNNKYNNGMTNTPKFGGTDALGRQDELKKETPKKEFFDLEFGSDDDGKIKKDFQKETLDQSKKVNEGFVSGPVLSNTGRSFFQGENIYAEKANLEEQNKMLMERLDKMQTTLDRLTGTYKQDPALAAALDPNKATPLNPLEEVQETLLQQESARQAKFTADVENARLQHDPTYNPSLVNPEVTTVTPELTTTTPEIEKKQRDFKTAALIAGVVAGGAAGILGGAAVGVPVAAAAGVVSIGGRISSYFLGRSITKIENQIKDPTLDKATRERLEKRESNLRKIQNVVQHITKFATGAALGAGISSFISNVAMGGHGLIWNRPEVPGGIPGGAEGSLGNTNIGQTEPTAPGGETPIPQTPEALPTENYDLFANGQVNLDGSAMNGWRLADVPSYYNNVPLEQIPASEFANSGSKAFQIFIENLRNTGISNAQLNEVPRVVLHKVLADGAYNQTNILEALQSMGYLK